MKNLSIFIINGYDLLFLFGSRGEDHYEKWNEGATGAYH